jgi:hypothetical protein
MRPVELVVKYLVGSPLPDERLEWAGVFVASSEDEVERAFADAEPPAHDDWFPDNLPKGNAKRYVNIAVRRLRVIAAEMGMVTVGRPVGSSLPPALARLAGRLGAFLDAAGSGECAGSRRPSVGVGESRRGARPSRARATRPVFDRLELGEAGRTAVFTTEVTQDSGRTGATLLVSACIAIDGTAAGRIEKDIAQPAILSITGVDGARAADGSSIALLGQEGRFELRVLVPDDCAVTVDAEVLPESAE